MRSPLAGLTILCLILFAACGALMMCMETLDHYGILGTGAPVQSITLLLVALATALVLVFFSTTDTQAFPHIGHQRAASALAPPTLLQAAFSDGILNPKAF